MNSQRSTAPPNSNSNAENRKPQTFSQNNRFNDRKRKPGNAGGQPRTFQNNTYVPRKPNHHQSPQNRNENRSFQPRAIISMQQRSLSGFNGPRHTSQIARPQIGGALMNSSRTPLDYHPQKRVKDEELELFFQQTKCYTKQRNWSIPKVNTIYTSSAYEFDEFQIMKNETEAEKDKILENYTQEEWDRNKDKFSINPLVVRILKHKVKLGHVTRNWTKAYEMFSKFPLIKTGQLNSVHIGDQHGGMITALNHYLHSHFEDVNWNWKAICDNPYYEDRVACDRLDDRLISKAYEHFCFGVDYSGYILDPENIDFFVRKCQEMGGINLAINTSSVSCRIDPKNKENLSFDWSFAGLVASLKALSNGGNLIMLSFTVLNSVNISIMYFLNVVFEEIHLYKASGCPETSMELFIIGINFKKNKNVENYIEAMKAKVGEKSYEKGAMFSKEQIPLDFLKQHKNIMEYYLKNYIISYKKFKFYDEKPDDEHTQHWQLITRLMPRFFTDKYNLKELPIEKRIIQPEILSMNICAKLSKLTIDYRFSKNEDCNLAIEALQTFDDKEYCDKLFLVFEKFKNTQDMVVWPYDTEDKTITNLLPVDYVLEYGKPIERVRKTIFITPSSMLKFLVQLEDKFKIYVTNSFKPGEVECVFDGKKKIVYQFKNNHGQSEKEFLKKVLNEWITLKPKKVQFKNFLFITHFSASFLRVFASFYKYLSVNLKGLVELDCYKSESDLQKIKEFEKLLKDKSSDFILCLTELKQVNKGEYFEIISNYNSQLLMLYIVKTFEILISKVQ